MSTKGKDTVISYWCLFLYTCAWGTFSFLSPLILSPDISVKISESYWCIGSLFAGLFVWCWCKYQNESSARNTKAFKLQVEKQELFIQRNTKKSLLIGECRQEIATCLLITQRKKWKYETPFHLRGPREWSAPVWRPWCDPLALCEF